MMNLSMMSTKKKIRSSSSSAANEIFGHEDLLMEIFQYLPVKSLIKFKCVSKSWLSLISNPYFCARHCKYNNQISITTGLYVEGYFDYECNLIPLVPAADDQKSNRTSYESRFTFVNYPTKGNVNILQSCNGLLLCVIYEWRNYDTKHYVYNPTTKQYTMLPIPDHEDEEFALIFDPSKSPHYKVICVVWGNTTHIYSSETGSWKVTPANVCEILEDDEDYYNSRGVYWNGAIHWESSLGICFYFEMEQEQFGKLQNFNCFSGTLKYFGESGGNLNAVEVYDSGEINVWEMKRDLSEWFVKYIVNLPSSNPYVDPGIGWFWYVGGEEDPIMVLQLYGGKVMCYNLEDQSFNLLYKSSGNRCIITAVAHQFIPSLACV